jgi:opacity protein-like surface antigen
METEMKRIAIFALLAAAAAAQAPDVQTIMDRVGRNQAQAVAQRQEFTFHQRQLLRLIRGNGKLAREENREYDVAPNDHGARKELVRFEGKYEYKGKYVTYDRPGYRYKDMDVDGELIRDLSEEMTNDKRSRDGIGADLFPLTTEEQRKYNFKLLAAEQYRGREVYRIHFEPKPHQEFDEASWKGEALIDAAEFQPVSVHTELAFRIPRAVNILLGTNIKGLGFSVTYRKFEDGVWFPVSYGGEFEVRAVFFYKRTISVNLTNAEFHRTNVNSIVTYQLANQQ